MSVLHKPAEEGPATGRYRILVVDDEPIARAMLGKMLGRTYDVAEAEDGAQALTMLEEGGYSLVIADIQMPVLDGWGLLEAVQKDARLTDIPVVIVTADGHLDSELRALRLGAMDVIQKPFVPEIMKNRVRNLLLKQDAARMNEKNRMYRAQLAQQAQTLWAAEHDELTGLLNKEAFYRKIRENLDLHPDRSYMIIRWDIDNFSVLNDMLGTKTGDRILCDIADAMRIFSVPDSVYARLQNDHFAYFYPMDQKKPADFNDLLTNWLAKYETDFKVVCRIGVYPIDDPALEPSIMCDRALLALRSIKGSYTNSIAFYDDSFLQKLRQEQALMAEVEPALANGEFLVYFQPQYNGSTGALLGAEALVRWNHPRLGLVAPGVFLPLFERNGYITRLDEFIWERTCQYLHRWREAYGELARPVSVNISRIDTYHANLCATLVALTDKYQLPRTMLRLEITESAYMEDPERLIGVVEGLKNAGFFVEMDDFGSAYSSLNTLKDVPVDLLKLDMKFLADTKHSARSGNILSSVVRMARWLKLPVIAEGVETYEQAKYLESIGCLYMQGYFFSRPIPAADYEPLQTQKPVGSLDKYRGVDLSSAEQFWDASAQTALLFNSFIGGAIIVEKSGDHIEILRANDRFFAEVCTTREAYLPAMSDLAARFNPRNYAAYLQLLTRAAETGDESSCELESRPFQDGGKPFWTRNRARLLVHNVGSDVFYVAVDNITQRVEAQEALNRQQQRLQTLYDTVPCGIMEFSPSPDDPAGPHLATSLNDTAFRLLGFARRQDFQASRMASDLFAVLHPADEALVRARVDAALDTEEALGCECRVRVGGEYRWFNLRIQSMRRPEGGSTVQVVFMDVTDQKLALQAAAREQARHLALEAESRRALEAANQRLTDVVAHMPAGMGIYRLEDPGHPVYVSDAACAMFGYTRETYEAALAGGSAVTFFPGRAQLRDDLYASLESGRITDLPRTPARRQDGSVFWLHGAVRMVRRADGELFCYATLYDATEAVLREQQAHLQAERYRLLNEATETITFDYDAPADRMELVLPQANHNRASLVQTHYQKHLEDLRCTSMEEADQRSLLEVLHAALAAPARGYYELRANFYRTGYRWYRVTYVSLAGENTGEAPGVYRIIGRLDDIDEMVRAADGAAPRPDRPRDRPGHQGLRARAAGSLFAGAPRRPHRLFAVYGPGQLQAGERHAGPRRGRPGAEPGGRFAAGAVCRRRPGGPLWRGRIFDLPAKRRRRHRAAGGPGHHRPGQRAAPRPGKGRAGRRRAGSSDAVQRGHSGAGAGCARVRPAVCQGGPDAVRLQARGAQLLDDDARRRHRGKRLRGAPAHGRKRQEAKK